MKFALLLVLLVLAAALVWVRAAPSDPARWHVDPGAAPDPGDGGVRLKPGDPGNPLRAASPAELLNAFDAALRAEPRITRLAGSAEEGQVTYIARSRLMGFPDYITVKAAAVEGGTGLWLYSRLRFGKSDMGVNRARSERVLERLDAILKGQG
ncbi:DUF1499 domain-containing protein [Anianabacter salinae]|uniref:DUF1499 domain-containing protein n=1 Tax=Anianabacter salinae TaxID=2851023 RepID=UPI00225E46DE|nr:DUF1499 domain-containing protein [Anianabacter salinae]MBV0912986.1 DUF1499 domain-containing protein [Anianabacter salinae]